MPTYYSLDQSGIAIIWLIDFRSLLQKRFYKIQISSTCRFGQFGFR